VELSNAFQPPLAGVQAWIGKESSALRAPVSLPVGVVQIREPSAASSSTASGLAWQSSANCSGVSRRLALWMSGRVIDPKG
jgi:hypothetical protein